MNRWVLQVQRVASDAAGVDVDAVDAELIGIVPALSLFSVDRPRDVVVESAGTGSQYLALPSSASGWVDGFSRVSNIEYPARQVPPVFVDQQRWVVTRDPSDVSVEKLLLLDSTPSSSEYVRVWFSTAWPTPDNADASVDVLGTVEFQAVTHLAASLCLAAEASKAARNRSGALPAQFVDGASKASNLRSAAEAVRAVYLRFIGRDTSPSGGGSSSNRPVSQPFDWDPGYDSLFHGRRR